MKVENGKWNVHVFTSARHRSGAELILLWWGRRNRPKQKLFGVQKEKEVMNKTVQAMSGPVQLRVFGAFVRKERQKL